MLWTEYIKTQPLIQSRYKRKIAAKRRLKVQSGLSDTLTSKDMNQLANDIIKTLKENAPAEVEKPVDYNDVMIGLKGGLGSLLGFKPSDYSSKEEIEEPVEEIVEETTEEPVEEVQELVVEESPDIAKEVGDIGKRIADEFKPLTPIAAPMPQSYPQTVNRPVPNKSPALGGISFWGDTKFW